MKRCTTPTLPDQFLSSYFPSGIESKTKMIRQVKTPYGNKVFMTNLNDSPKKASRSIARGQAKELRLILEDENLEPSAILHKIATYSTPYAKLLEEAAVEFETFKRSGISHTTQNLEQESKLKSARVKAEIVKQRQIIQKLKTEQIQIQQDIATAQEEIKEMNKTIDLLNNFEETHPLIPIQTHRCTSENPEETNEISLVPACDNEPKLNDSIYRLLWNERCDLMQTISQLEKRLAQAQQQQIHEIRNTIDKKVRQSRSRSLGLSVRLINASANSSSLSLIKE